jgi:hypothetical protein
MGWMAGIQFPAGTRDFCIPQCPDCSEALPDFFCWVPGALSLVVKQLWCEAYHSPTSGARVKNDGAIPLLPHTSSLHETTLPFTPMEETIYNT